MLVLAAALLLAAGPGSTADEATDGRLLFNNACRTCHTMQAGDNRLGPHLAGIIGRPVGAVAGFPYSSAMRNAGFVWTEPTLDRFLEDPDATLPGHGMRPFGGIGSPSARKAIIRYLREQS
jgi:cytochrome c